jgi:hypothetical protein
MGILMGLLVFPCRSNNTLILSRLLKKKIGVMANLSEMPCGDGGRNIVIYLLETYSNN